MTRLLILDPSLKGPGGHHFDYTRQVVSACADLGIRTDIATHRKFGAALSLLEGLDRRHPRAPLPLVYPHFRRTTYHPCSDLIGVRSLSRLPKRSSRPLWQRLKCTLLPWRSGDRLEQELSQLSATARQSLAHLEPTQQSIVLETLCDLESLMRVYEQALADASPTPISQASISQDSRESEGGNPELWRGVSVFHTTLSELDYLAIALGLHEARLPHAAGWSLQFHFDLLLGRPADYASQLAAPRTQRAIQTFQIAQQLVGEHPVKLFATSEPLAEQYNALQPNRVETLTYPINPAFHPTAEAPSKPYRITLAGGVRGEKGQRGLDPICSAIAPSILDSGAGLLVAQRRKRRWWRKPQLHVSSSHSGPNGTWIQYADHPLAEEDYVRLIREAGVGLLLYHGSTYYSRRAGVLGEFLAAGVPVIVPAGCWLSDQVDRANRPYWQLLVGSLGQTLIPRNSLGAHENLEAKLSKQSAHRCWLSGVQAGDLLVVAASIPQSVSLEPRHLKLEIRSPQSASSPTRSSDRQVAQPNDEREREVGVFAVLEGMVWGCLPLPATLNANTKQETCEAVLEMSWAFEDPSPLDVSKLSVWRIPSPDNDSLLPWGAVGLSVASPCQVPRAIEQVVSQMTHYRRHAVDYAPSWKENHDPHRTAWQVTGGSLPDSLTQPKWHRQTLEQANQSTSEAA